MRKIKSPEKELSGIKTPPHFKSMEEDVLGLMMIEHKNVQIVKEVLKYDDFYTTHYKTICKAIFDVSNVTSPDLMMVADWLIKNGLLEDVGGVLELTRLTNRVSSNSNLKAYALCIKQYSIKRKLIDFGGSMLKMSNDDTNDIFDLIIEAENQLKGINFELSEMKITSIGSKAMNVIKDFEDAVYKAREGVVDENAIYTGFNEWDEVNGRLFPGLYVVAGRPGMGKGVHMTEGVCRMAKRWDIGVINGEMTDEQFLKRIGCNLMGIDNFLFKKNPKYVTDKEMEILREGMQEALNLKLHLEGSRNIHKIANKIKLWVQNYGVRCVFADFLTLFKVPPELERYYTKTQSVDYILDVFTQLCKDLKIPIILYVQMNREILGRHGVKEPNLADLKQSGSIEELAYQVSFLHRPEYYDDKATVDEFGQDTKGLMYQIIAKHRDGKLDRLKLKVDLAKSQIKSWSNNDPIVFNEINDKTPF